MFSNIETAIMFYRNNALGDAVLTEQVRTVFVQCLNFNLLSDKNVSPFTPVFIIPRPRKFIFARRILSLVHKRLRISKRVS